MTTAPSARGGGDAMLGLDPQSPSSPAGTVVPSGPRPPVHAEAQAPAASVPRLLPQLTLPQRMERSSPLWPTSTSAVRRKRKSASHCVAGAFTGVTAALRPTARTLARRCAVAPIRSRDSSDPRLGRRDASLLAGDTRTTTRSAGLATRWGRPEAARRIRSRDGPARIHPIRTMRRLGSRHTVGHWCPVESGSTTSGVNGFACPEREWGFDAHAHDKSAARSEHRHRDRSKSSGSRWVDDAFVVRVPLLPVNGATASINLL
jgi:hypothetical protein